ncbi:MAG TPA: DUF5668 domain-containing protein [Syntrophales bacterium]|nr:DUF5668 domain-containing protein [Syntrophales bacterium]
MEERQKMRIITGAMILVALGALFLLEVLGLYKLEKSWPILLIVVAIGILIQQPKDLIGWIIGAAGVAILFMRNWYTELSQMVLNVITSLGLIALGVYILYRDMKKKKGS